MEAEKMEIEELVKRQRAYFATGKTKRVGFRVAALQRLQEAIRKNEEAIEKALKEDLNKSSFESYMTEVGMTLEEISYFLKNTARLARTERVRTPLSQFPARSYVKKEPLGVTLILSPWNYPFMLSLIPVVGAIAAGNCCILKPSAYAPKTAGVLKRLIGSVFPAGYVAVVEGGREENKRLLEQKFDKIFFTGSKQVGRLVMEQAAKHLTPVTLELGGKSPCIIETDAPLSMAAKRIVFGKFLNSGQTCVAPDYCLVQRAVRDAFLEELVKWTKKLIGEEPLANPDYPRMVNAKHFDRVMGLIEGETVVCGGYGNKETLQIAPTILKDVSLEDEVMQEEIFGPVLPVLTFDRLEEAERIISSGPKPLALYLFTKNRRTVKRITEGLPYGGGCVNDTIIHLASTQLGFGGVGESGLGSYHGKRSFDTFTHEKSIVDKAIWLDLPVRYMPYTRTKERLLRWFLR